MMTVADSYQPARHFLTLNHRAHTAAEPRQWTRRGQPRVEWSLRQDVEAIGACLSAGARDRHLLADRTFTRRQVHQAESVDAPELRSNTT